MRLVVDDEVRVVRRRRRKTQELEPGWDGERDLLDDAVSMIIL